MKILSNCCQNKLFEILPWQRVCFPVLSPGQTNKHCLTNISDFLSSTMFVSLATMQTYVWQTFFACHKRHRQANSACQAMFVNVCVFGHLKNLVWQTFTLIWIYWFAFDSWPEYQCLSWMFLMGGLTYKHVMQAECQMFAKQCLFVWPGLYNHFRAFIFRSFQII